jgi:hypothetical protein
MRLTRFREVPDRDDLTTGRAKEPKGLAAGH